VVKLKWLSIICCINHQNSDTGYLTKYPVIHLVGLFLHFLNVFLFSLQVSVHIRLVYFLLYGKSVMSTVINTEKCL
jgi:hypothetical protein